MSGSLPGTGPRPDGLSPEAELLLEACASGPAESIRLLARASLDWSHLIALAHQNRVIPLLLSALQEAGVEAPDPHREGMLAYCRQIEFLNLFLHQRMLELLELLRAEGIDVIPYKGPILAATLYPDPGLRQCVDLDLLVRRPEDVPAVSRLLIERGYEPLRKLSADELEAVLENDCELHFRIPEVEILLEIHWQFLPRQHTFGLSTDAFWKNLQTVPIAGAQVSAFPPEDLLLLLSIHGGEKHQWLRLRMLCDVARILALHPDLDHTALIERARALGREHTLLLGEFLAWVLLDAPLPDEVLSRCLPDRKIRAQAGLALGRSFTLDFRMPRLAAWRTLQRDLVRLARKRGRELPDPPGTMGYLAAILRPDWGDRQELPLPPRLSFLLFLYRPLRLVRRSVQRMSRSPAGAGGLVERLKSPARRWHVEGRYGPLVAFLGFVNRQVKDLPALLALPWLLWRLRKTRAVTDPEANVGLAFHGFGGLIRPLQIREEIEPFLRSLAAEKPAVLVEIGTARGGTLFLLCRAAARDDATIVSIDLPGGIFGGGYSWWKRLLYGAFPRRGQKLHLLRADSHDERTKLRVRSLLSETPVDCLVIDGDHSYEGVRADYEAYSPLVRKGGMIVFHDIVTNPARPDVGVDRFWDEVKDGREAQEIVRSWAQGCMGLGILRN